MAKPHVLLTALFVAGATSFQKRTLLYQKQREFRELIGHQTPRRCPMLSVNKYDGESNLQSPKSDETTQDTEIPLLEKVEVVSYRISLLVMSLSFAAAASASLLEGSGLSPDTMQQIQDSSHAATSWSPCITALLAPPFRSAATDSKNDDLLNAALLIVNDALPTLGSFAILVEIVQVIQSSLASGEIPGLEITASETLDKVSGIFVSGLCLREILFFGLAYKVEATIAIVLCIMQGLNALPESIYLDGLALSLLVLSAGKVFEPLASDLKPDQSSFFLANKNE